MQVQLKSLALQKYVSAVGGGGGNVNVDQDSASTWETFKVNCQWKVVSWSNESELTIHTFGAYLGS